MQLLQVQIYKDKLGEGIFNVAFTPCWLPFITQQRVIANLKQLQEANKKANKGVEWVNPLEVPFHKLFKAPLVENGKTLVHRMSFEEEGEIELGTYYIEVGEKLPSKDDDPITYFINDISKLNTSQFIVKAYEKSVEAKFSHYKFEDLWSGEERDKMCGFLERLIKSGRFF